MLIKNAHVVGEADGSREFCGTKRTSSATSLANPSEGLKLQALVGKVRFLAMPQQRLEGRECIGWPREEMQHNVSGVDQL